MNLATNDINELLAAWESGNRESQQRVLEALYPDLKRIASRALVRHGRNLTLQTTDVVHEAYLRLGDQRNLEWANRGHFLSIVARLTRRLIVDHYRRRSSDKRGGDEPLISLDDVDIPVPGSFTSWLDLDAALEGLERVDPVAAEVVQLRYIGGMSLEDTANALGIGSATVGRKWRFARTWLARWLAD